MTPFFQLTLRTSDVPAARAFYGALLGETALDVVQLHEQAVARGARPHWLGFLDVGEVDRAAAAFVERGATSLGPKWVNPRGLEAAMMCDPGGAIVALAKPPPREGAVALGPGVAWHLLHTPDVQRARSTYGELFGWAFEPPLDLGPFGVVHPFAWERGAPLVGAVTDAGARPGVQPHWLLFLPVAALGRAVQAVRSGGGVVVDAGTPRTGEQIAVCDDPQGAAFALRQDPPSP